MPDETSITKILTEMIIEDKELFVKFLRRYVAECEGTQDKTTLVASAHQSDENKAE